MIKKTITLFLATCIICNFVLVAEAAPNGPGSAKPKIIVQQQEKNEKVDRTKSSTDMMDKKDINLVDKQSDQHVAFKETYQTEPIAKVFPDSLSVENGRINIQMIDASVIDILNSVSEKLDKKILINSQVQGRVSIRLTNATLSELLNLLSSSVGFSWIEKDGVIIISTDSQLTSPTFFPIKYANMADIKKSLDILRLGSNITVNSNPPGIIVNAPPDKLQQVQELIQKLDYKTPSPHYSWQVKNATSM